MNTPQCRQRYDDVDEVHAKMKSLADCIRQHLETVREHVLSQVDGKVADTGEPPLFL